jgi:DNA-binding transcriptional LysR family regulator
MGAAKRFGAEQPTLWRHIAELEAQVGSPLFKRTGRGVLPTAVALRIANAARELTTLFGERGRHHTRRAFLGRRMDVYVFRNGSAAHVMEQRCLG